MSTDIFQPITNPITGETFRCISASQEAFVMEWTLAPKGYVPLEHVHLLQDEEFKVQEGQIRLMLEGKAIIAGPGQSALAPKGVAHIAYNDGPKFCAAW